MFNLRKKYKTLNVIEISERALLSNYTFLSKKSGLQIAPVLKSNAYGHGLTFVAKIFDKVGAPFFCVDSLYEAYELLNAGIKTHILIMGYTNLENLKVKKLPFSFVVYDKETLEVLYNYQPQAGVHVFVDTGMNREGVKLKELTEFLIYCKKFKNLKIEGLTSHFGASERFNIAETKEQIINFQKAIRIFKKMNIKPQWMHFGNSAANLLTDLYKGKIGNVVRAGVALYGLGDELNDNNLQPALTIKTVLSQIKLVKRGEKVGYDFTYTAKKDTMIGILPYGYYDGLDIRLSNKGFVLVDTVQCPIIGRVSMNIATIDITNVKNPYIGQSVIVYSNKNSDKNSFHSASFLTQTIQRDLLVHLASSTKRIVVQ